MTEADFDARCRSMLESSTAVAPEPRADLFADSAPKGADLRGAKWGGTLNPQVLFWYPQSA